ncbi:hypothetical protein [Streptomyces sp. NPDC003996]
MPTKVPSGALGVTVRSRRHRPLPVINAFGEPLTASMIDEGELGNLFPAIAAMPVVTGTVVLECEEQSM